MKLYMVIGHGPNGLEIPLVPFSDRGRAEEFVKQFPGDEECLAFDFAEKEGPYVTDDFEHTELGEMLYSKLFKDSAYYTGCGGCYALSVLEVEEGKPMVAWDLD